MTGLYRWLNVSVTSAFVRRRGLQPCCGASASKKAPQSACTTGAGSWHWQNYKFSIFPSEISKFLSEITISSKHFKFQNYAIQKDAPKSKTSLNYPTKWEISGVALYLVLEILLNRQAHKEKFVKLSQNTRCSPKKKHFRAFSARSRVCLFFNSFFNWRFFFFFSFSSLDSSFCNKWRCLLLLKASEFSSDWNL